MVNFPTIHGTLNEIFVFMEHIKFIFIKYFHKGSWCCNIPMIWSQSGFFLRLMSILCFLYRTLFFIVFLTCQIKAFFSIDVELLMQFFGQKENYINMKKKKNISAKFVCVITPLKSVWSQSFFSWWRIFEYFKSFAESTLMSFLT